VQCPESTDTHPDGSGIKCQQISGGDGFATMADGTQIYLFAFGPLSGMADIINGLPGTQPASVFNQTSVGRTDLTIGAPYPGYGFNGAVGMVPDPEFVPSALYPTALNGHVDPRPIMDVGTLNGSIPGPLMAVDEDDEFFLTLTNVGQIMRPDLFEQHTVHWHGYPNASAFYDGVPDASVAINIGGSFTYYYLAPDAGTYLWHCHITPPEHLQLGMVGQIFVRPRQDNTPNGTDLGVALMAQQSDNRKKCNDDDNILCSNPLPAGANATTGATGALHVAGTKYAYNDGDGSTAYDVEYPIQMHGFDANFHFVGMTFNPETFVDLKDKYFLLNGRSYPDTVNPDAIGTKSADGVDRYAQPMRALIEIPNGGKALLRLSDLNVTEFHTLASLGIPMKVIALNAKLLRDQDGNNMYYETNSITLGGGESLDVILDASTPEYANCNATTPCTFYLYTPQLDHLSNGAENFGGMMTEIRVGGSSI
jgi:FtsP/CotA-like multicopper oxidase with cupredoxin domain